MKTFTGGLVVCTREAHTGAHAIHPGARRARRAALSRRTLDSITSDVATMFAEKSSMPITAIATNDELGVLVLGLHGGGGGCSSGLVIEEDISICCSSEVGLQL